LGMLGKGVGRTNRIKKNLSLKEIKKVAIKILKRHGVKKAGIFGSYVRGEQREDSDIDIIVEPPKGIGFGFAGIELELEEALERKWV